MAKRVAVVAIVVGNNDEPVFLRDLRGTSSGSDDASNNSEEYLYQFILHSSLDMVSEKQWQSQALYLGVVETFREFSVSAWVSVSGVKILLLHRGYTEVAIKNFLKSVHSVWLKAALNSLHDREEAISGANFDARVIAIAQKTLGSGV